MNGRIVTLITLMLLILSACTSMSLSGIYHLSQLSPLTVEPKQIKVAVKTNENIKISTGDVNIGLGYWADDNSISIEEKFLVEVIHDAVFTSEIFDDKQTDEHVTILQLTAKDAERFEEVQTIVATYQAKDGQGKGMFSFGITNFCLRRDLPNNQLTIDMKIQTNTDEGYFSFLSDFNLTDIAKQEKETNVDLYCPA